jgi:hypothetical protein
MNTLKVENRHFPLSTILKLTVFLPFQALHPWRVTVALPGQSLL